MLIINPCYYKIIIPHPSTKNEKSTICLPALRWTFRNFLPIFNIFIALRTEKEEATNCYLFYFSNWPTPKAQVRRTLRLPETQLRVLQVESLSFRCQEDVQTMKLNYIKYTACLKSCNMNIVNTCESTIWNPLAISLEINLG